AATQAAESAAGETAALEAATAGEASEAAPREATTLEAATAKPTEAATPQPAAGEAPATAPPEAAPPEPVLARTRIDPLEGVDRLLHQVRVEALERHELNHFRRADGGLIQFLHQRLDVGVQRLGAQQDEAVAAVIDGDGQRRRLLRTSVGAPAQAAPT